MSRLAGKDSSHETSFMFEETLHLTPLQVQFMVICCCVGCSEAETVGLLVI